MEILDLTERIVSEVELGMPFSVYRGGAHVELDPDCPHVLITLADIPSDSLTATDSFLDFIYDPEKKILHHPWISLIPEHRRGTIARKLNYVMEEVGRQMGCTYIRLYLYTIHNEKLERVLPRFGYTTSGIDECGVGYLEKRL